MDKNNNNMVLIAIVAIVAIVGIVVAFAGNKAAAPADGENVGGLAVSRGIDTKIDAGGLSHYCLARTDCIGGTGCGGSYPSCGTCLTGIENGIEHYDSCVGSTYTHPVNTR